MGSTGSVVEVTYTFIGNNSIRYPIRNTSPGGVSHKDDQALYVEGLAYNCQPKTEMEEVCCCCLFYSITTARSFRCAIVIAMSEAALST